jgi:para-nitrobenzyl esterase
MKFGMRWGSTVSAIALGLSLAGCGGNSDGPELRRTAYGAIEGSADSGTGTYSWKGVPFAKPPVGELRWKAPVEPEPWTGTLAATTFGNACIQNGRIYGPGANNTYDATIGTTLNTAVGSEDCLTLNIWRPASGEENLPVIFFIYGGSNISGYTADPVYDGGNLAKAANAVVVTANYRVGVFGFFNLEQLASDANANDGSGNFAILDSLQALRFVQANIAEFGGNPDNVTVMGQSAGAINTWALLTSPQARGLLHKAIPISGGISLATNLPPGSLPTLSPADSYRTQANALLHELLVADGTVADIAAAPAWVAARPPAEIADYIRGKDAGTILNTVLTKLAARGLSGSGPIPDGTVLPTDPIAAIKAGNYMQVPILAGNTRDEGKLFAPFLTLFGGPPGMIIGDADRFATMMNYEPDGPVAVTIDQIIHPFYLPVDAPDTGYNARTDLLGSIFMTVNRNDVLNAVRSQQQNVWFYRFDWDNEPAPWNDIYGAAHAFDLPFIFGNFGPSLFSNVVNSAANAPGRLALSKAMIDSVAAFARNGDPNNPSLGVTWQPWPSQLLFDADLARPAITVVPGP